MQNYKNHARYYPLHHFVITPLTLVYFIWSIVKVIQAFDTDLFSNAIFFLIGALIILILPLLARLYALKNQDRIIRMETRQRYFELTGKSFRELEPKLRLSQIIALRFASDEELLSLIEETIKNDLSAKVIKQRIKNWQADIRRV
ncbi:hypothetical protein SAMN06295967_11083 [Belliella buryatensis]|uniref:Uncharacterized protein n=1 Tax=Belliella buryatensis TaxID=1500549 RepID=A0A239ET37_9BACT|nr:DUF6526 family protein [Belliella buryatensis]SNS47183.1 hypothetical protein SAMN06295967_11083 [Belliella buryatensis]